jgi:hypothetical protein
LLNALEFKSIINIAAVIMAVASEAFTNNTTNAKSKISKVPCEICGLLFDTVDIKEEHKKLEHVEHKRPSGVG